MKINSFLRIAFGLFISLQAYAQTAPTTTDGTTTRRERLANTTPEQRANQQTTQMKKRLSLTADQEPTVAAINLNYARKMQTVLETGERNRQTLKQVRGMADQKDAELKAVFTADQYTQYETFKDGQKDRMKERRGQRTDR